ncbi:diaminobutyrate--2-oxoglutarate transaminase [Coralliovum pocilloporae]|uniref:diaminobutyrate--2-oxoglutarate transaminase n=1 Tax=Coralliovum pocilloporae TaxID=3066369 RepID=UPI003306B94A
MDIREFQNRESNVCRYGPVYGAVFSRADGASIWDENGTRYIDFLIGSGAMNYGHNHPKILAPSIDYLRDGNIQMSLDMYTTAKRSFLQTFNEYILEPRGMDYKIQFPGPTGTNANEAALALARKVTGRSSVFAFSNAFHGMSLGSLSVSGSASTSKLGGVARHDVVRVPYDSFPNESVNSLEYINALLSNEGSGVEKPAAIILETIQAEGGMFAASKDWLRGIRKICDDHNILLIVDDIQAGCGRTGDYFSFEEADIKPDIITLSKSLSGAGFPFSIVLISPDIDFWKPGEHSGTFRGSNLAFISSAAAAKLWKDSDFLASARNNRRKLQAFADEVCSVHKSIITDKRGRGLMVGLKCKDRDIAQKIHNSAFSGGLIIETSGADRDVLKLVPPINISDEEMEIGLNILNSSIEEHNYA